MQTSVSATSGTGGVTQDKNGVLFILFFYSDKHCGCTFFCLVDVTYAGSLQTSFLARPSQTQTTKCFRRLLFMTFKASMNSMKSLLVHVCDL